MTYRLGRADLAAFDSHQVPFTALLRRSELDPGDRGDRSQGFTSKPEGADPLQLFEAVDLAGRVAIECQQDVVTSHAPAVVDHPHKPLATGFEHDAHFVGTCIERVLDQLLDHRRRPLDDLTGGDLTDQMVGQDVNFGHDDQVSAESPSSSCRGNNGA